MNAVFSQSFFNIFTCQYPLLRSRVENHFDPDKLSKQSSIRGKGNASFVVTVFNFLKSTPNLEEPSFFFTSTIGEAHGLSDGSMTRRSVISAIWPDSFSRWCTGNLRACWRIGGEFPVLIWCWTMSVLPISLLERENMSACMFSSSALYIWP